MEKKIAFLFISLLTSSASAVRVWLLKYFVLYVGGTSTWRGKANRCFSAHDLVKQVDNLLGSGMFSFY